MRWGSWINDPPTGVRPENDMDGEVIVE